MDIQHVCQMSLLTFERVKVRGQNHCSECLPLAIVWPWFKVFSLNLSIRRK